MKNVLSSLSLIGILLGVALFSWVLFLFNKGHSNNASDKIDDYINNCTPVKLKINDYKNITKDIKGNAKLLGTTTFYSNQTLFYDKSYKKWFVIEFIAGDAGEAYLYSKFIKEINKGENISAFVNKKEMDDAGYGVLQKPIPIFKFIRDDTGHHKTYAAFNNSDGAYPDNHIAINKSYRGSVSVYLSYIKNKADFKKMFGQ